MSGNDSGSSRIADMMQGVPLDFGGIGTASWRSDPTPAFPVFVDDDDRVQPLQERRPRARPGRGHVGAPLQEQNRPRARTRVAQKAAAAPFQIYGDENNAPAGMRHGELKTFGQVPFSIFSDAENVPPSSAASRQYQKTFSQVAAASLQMFNENQQSSDAFCQAPTTNATGAFQFFDENKPAGKAFSSTGFQIYEESAVLRPLAAQDSGQPSRPSRAQQRKQKLKQRPLQELQNSKRAALQEAPTAAGRLPAPLSVCTAASAEPAPLSGSDKENASPEILYESLLRPAQDVPMVSPSSSLHTSLDSITLSARRGRLDALFSYEEYAADLYTIMREAELSHRPRQDFMARQPDITVTMRSILVDWLVEVNDEYKLNAETLHLAVNYIDRFLSVMTVVRAKLQLVGTTALFIASKFEEIYPPTVAEFVYITDDTYSATQLKRMEHVMLKMLAFDMSAPTANWFLNYYLDNIGDAEDTVKHLAQYLLELGLVQYDLCNQHLSSHQAGAAIFIARFTAGHEPWTPHMERVTGLSRLQLRPCVEDLFVLYGNARELPQQAVIEKFSKDKYLCVAALEPPASLAGVV